MTEEELKALQESLAIKEAELKAKEEELTKTNIAKLTEYEKSISEKDKALAKVTAEAEKIKKDMKALEELAKKKDSTFEDDLAKLRAEQEKSELSKSLLEKDNEIMNLKALHEQLKKDKDEEISKEKTGKEQALIESEKNKLIAEKSNNKFLVEELKNAKTLEDIQKAVKMLDKPELEKASKLEEEAGSDVLGKFRKSQDKPSNFLEELENGLSNKKYRF